MIEAEKSPSLVDRVLTSTRERILRGEYQPGTRLRLNKLAEDSGVSLIPVREALRVLETERLVRILPNKGATVAELSVEDMNDLYAVRMRLETEVLASSKPLSPDEAVSLKTLLTNMSAAREAGDTARAMRLHRSFHFGLYERAESGWYPYLIDILWKHAERYQWLSLNYRHDVADDEHRAILDALEKGTIDAAMVAMRTHLNTTRGLLEHAYTNVPELNAVEP